MIEFIFQLILLLHIILLPSYLYLSWNFGYWRKRGLRTALPLTIFGSLPSIVTRNRNLIYEIDTIYGKCKHRSRLLGFYFLRQPQIMVLDSRLVHEVLEESFMSFQETAASAWMHKGKENKLDKLALYSPVWSSGKQWKLNRNIASSAVMLNKLQNAYGIWQSSARRLSTFLTDKLTLRPAVEVSDLSKRYVADALCSFIWGIDAHTLCHTAERNVLLQMIEKSIKQTQRLRCYSLMAAIMPMFSKLWPFRLLSKTADNYFTQLTENAITLQQQSQLEEQQQHSGTFLSQLLAQSAEEHMSVDEMTGHCISMLLDGFAQTSDLLIYALYYLARSPRVQDKLRAEIFTAKNREKCSDIPFRTLMSLQYLNQCVYETLRLSPILPYCRRVCSSTNTINLSKQKSAQIEERMTLLIPTYSFHHDAVIFSEPNSFIPERFESIDHAELTERCVFLPFGAGPRNCLGKNLSILTIKSALVSVLSQFTIRTCLITQHENNKGVNTFLLNLNDKLILEFNEI